MDKSLITGSQMISPMFSKVGVTDTVSIDSITVSGYTRYEDGGEGTGGEVVIKVRDPFGATAKDEGGNYKMYYYFDNENTSGDGEGTGAGWYVNNEVNAENKVNGSTIKFDVGEALWVSAVAGLKVCINGQVVQGDVDIPLIAGSRTVANPYPVTLSIDAFSVSGYTRYEDDGDGTGGEVVIKFLDPFGATAKNEDGSYRMYYYFDNENTSGDGEGTGAGWYINNEVSAENKVTGDAVTILAGNGVWVSGVKGYTLNVKAPAAVKTLDDAK